MTNNVEKQTKLPEIPSHWEQNSSESDRLENVPRRIVVRDLYREAGFHIPFHSHGWGQLLFIAEGLIQVSARDVGYWVVPPQRAVWIPAYVEHDARAIHPVQMRNVYVSPSVDKSLPDHCQVVNVTPLLRELILTIAGFDTLYDEQGAEGRLVSVFLDQLRVLPEAPLHLPDPQSAVLREIAGVLRSNPSNQCSIDEWASQTGLSARTLARRFQKETGMTFGQWRKQLRLLVAVSRIAQGVAVATIAQDLGYESQSAFIAMFKRAFGKTPGRYFQTGE